MFIKINIELLGCAGVYSAARGNDKRQDGKKEVKKFQKGGVLNDYPPKGFPLRSKIHDYCGF